MTPFGQALDDIFDQRHSLACNFRTTQQRRVLLDLLTHEIVAFILLLECEIMRVNDFRTRLVRDFVSGMKERGGDQHVFVGVNRMLTARYAERRYAAHTSEAKNALMPNRSISEASRIWDCSG